jgi:hypothetical protein
MRSCGWRRESFLFMSPIENNKPGQHSFNLPTSGVQGAGPSAASPAGAVFGPASPFPFASTQNPVVHPLCRVVSEEQLVRRATRRMLAGQVEAARDLLHAMLRAQHYPQPVSRPTVELRTMPKPGKEAA